MQNTITTDLHHNTPQQNINITSYYNIFTSYHTTTTHLHHITSHLHHTKHHNTFTSQHYLHHNTPQHHIYITLQHINTIYTTIYNNVLCFYCRMTMRKMTRRKRVVGWYHMVTYQMMKALKKTTSNNMYVSTLSCHFDSFIQYVILEL